MASILRFIAVCVAAFLGFTHLGAWIPAADSAAVVRPLAILFGAGVVLVLLIFRMRSSALSLFLVMLVSGGEAALALRGGGDGLAGPVSVYQKNMLWNGSERGALLEDILAADADFVTLQETSRENMSILDGLDALYPHRLACTTAGNGGIAILSKYPLEQPEERCEFGEGVVIAKASMPNGRMVWVGSVHLNRPFPYGQAAQVPVIAAALAELDGPIVIGGDFNMVPWGSPVKEIARAAGAVRLGGYVSSFQSFGWYVPLPIDQVIVPEGAGGLVETRPAFGSDHLGLLARFSL